MAKCKYTDSWVDHSFVFPVRCDQSGEYTNTVRETTEHDYPAMSDADRDRGGKYTPTVSDEDILSAIDRAHAPIVTASELAEELPIGRGALRERLLDLEDRTLVDRKTVGARAVVWWLVDTDDRDAPAAPLRDLVGLLEEDAATVARERSRKWRHDFDREILGEDANVGEPTQ